MKKIIDLLTYLLIFNILICLSLLLGTYYNKNNISQTSLEIYISNNDNYNLIEQILKDTNNEDLIKFIDYIELDVNHHIKNDTNNYTSFTITLPQDKSFIALYKKTTNDTYIFHSIVDNLNTIDNFYFYNQFFIVEQLIKIPSNIENNKKFIEIFLTKEKKCLSVLKKDIYKEINDVNKDYLKIIESSSIDFLNSNPTQVVYVSTCKYFYNNIDTSYTVITKEIYEWKSTLNEFKIKSREIL